MLTHLRNLFHHRVSRAIGFIFFICGFVFGSWTSCIPYIKDKFSLDEAQLGLLLLSMPAGVLVMNPMSILILKKIGHQSFHHPFWCIDGHCIRTSRFFSSCAIRGFRTFPCPAVHLPASMLQ
jgi:hypothetical protein